MDLGDMVMSLVMVERVPVYHSDLGMSQGIGGESQEAPCELEDMWQ